MLKKVGEVWDYLMRRKPILLALLVALILGIFVCSKIFPSSSSNTGRLSESSPEVSYNNSLYFVIYGQNQQPSYTLSFEQDFQRANIFVSANPLAAEAYVRIFNEQGQLVIGEYTTMQDQTDPEESDELDDLQSSISAITYTFTDADKQYTLELKPGYIVEVRTDNGCFYSTLDRREAQKFSPTRGQTETYAVMENGLRKAGWSEAEGEQQMYNLLKTYIVEMIENYQARVTDEVLNNKNLDLANKTRLILSYYMLKAEDQASYVEFIDHLRRGGSPVIHYTGPTEYEVGSEIEIQKFLTVTDGEDGELSTENIQIIGEVDTNEPGKYLVIIKAKDSDDNQTELKLEITVFEMASAEPVEPVDPAPAPEKPVVIEPILPVRPAMIEPEVPSEKPVVGILDRPSQATTSQPQVTMSTPITSEDASDDNAQVEQSSSTVANKSDTPTVNYQVPNTTASTASAKKQVSFGDLALIGLGIITFFGLIKFIFDHYVR